MILPGMISPNIMFPNDVESRESRLIEYWICNVNEKKPEIDDVLCQYLYGDMLENALAFIKYIRAAKMKIKHTSEHTWSVKYKGKRVLDITINQDSWGVRLVYDHIKTGRSIFTPRKVEEIKSLISLLNTPYSGRNEPVACAAG